MSLAFPEIEEVAASPAAVALVEPAPAALDLSKINITDIALAQFGQAQRDVDAAEKALKGVQHDLSTPKKLADAISLRERLINKPRAEARKVSKALKSKLTSVNAEVTAREGEIVADFARVEGHITPQIDAREEEIAREKERDEARKAGHIENIAKIAAMLNGAEEKSAERLAKGIQIVDGLLIEGYDEYTAEAEATRTRVLLGLKALHEKAVEREAREAEAERLRRETTAQQQAMNIGARVMACMTMKAAGVREHLDLLKATVYAPDTAEFVLRAHHDAITQLGELLAQAEQREKDAAELERLRTAAAPKPVDPERGTHRITEADAHDMMARLLPSAAPVPAPAEPTETAPPPVFDSTPQPILDAAVPMNAEQTTQAFLHATHVPPQIAEDDRYGLALDSGEFVPASRLNAPPAPPAAQAVVMAALANALPAHRLDSLGDPLLMEDVRSFVAHVLEAFETKFPTQPKPGVEWWAATRAKAIALQQQLTNSQPSR